MPDKTNFLADVAALARAGYSVSDVKEILQMSKAQPDAAAGEPEEPGKQPATEPEKSNPEKEDEPSAPQQADSIEDLKKQVAAMQEQNKTLQEQLKQAQQNNVNQNYANTQKTQTNDEQLAAIIKGFM